MTESRIRLRGVACLSAAMLLLTTPIGAQKKTFSDTTRVVLVEVPVQVTVKGEPVRGLTKDDFELYDGKKKVDISAFEVVDLGQVKGPGAAPDVPIAGRRHFMAFFDLSLSDPNSVTRAREAAADLVMSSLHPTDLVAVATYSRQKGPQLVLGFTTDRNQVRHAIETLGLYAPAKAVRDPLGLVIGDLDSGSQPSSTGAAGLDTQAELQQQLNALANLRNAAQRGEQISRIASLMDGLGAVGQMLQNVEGRKHVLFLSEGFDGELLFGTEDIDVIAENARAVEEGRTQDVDNEARFGDNEARRVVNRALEKFRESNATIQAVDIGGLAAGGSVTSRGRAGKNMNLESLQYMARQTGGEMFANYNDLGGAMGDLLTSTSVTYLMAFTPRDLEDDGRFRPIRVKLKGGPRGADVVHRPGYFVPKAITERNPFEQRMTLADELVGGQGGGAIEASVLATAFPVPDAKAYVPVLVEASGADLQRGQSEDTLPIELYAYAMDDSGAVRDFFVRSLGLDRSQVGAVLDATGFKYWGHFDLEAGEYTVRVLVRNPRTGASGLEVVSVQVPDAASSNVALLPPLFPEQPTKWVLGREDASEQRAGVDYPFLLGGNAFIPAARPEVPKGQRAPLGLVAYNLGEGSLAASCQLFSESGEMVEGAEVTLDGSASGADGKVDVPATFRASKVTPGDYVLVVTLRNTVNQREQTSSISIRVVG